MIDGNGQSDSLGITVGLVRLARKDKD